MSLLDTSRTTRAHAAAEAICDGLADTERVILRDGAGSQALGAGALGVALLHLERARTGHSDPAIAHTWMRHITAAAVNASTPTNLYNGAPGVAFALAATSVDGRYERARQHLHGQVKAVTARRLDLAHQRIDAGNPGAFHEYSALSGLAGLAIYLLGTEPDSDLTSQVLCYFVRLTEPLCIDGTLVPGWWVDHDPHLKRTEDFAAGHVNFGAAHGIPGALTCLALALRDGVSVPGQIEAIEHICTWYETWQQPEGWWPQWITLAEQRARVTLQHGPGRPSWCYGTPGIARALQLAAIALGDTARQHAAEDTLLRCIRDEYQLNRLGDAGLCHGNAGLYQIVQRAAADSRTPELATFGSLYLERLLEQHDTKEDGFLDGAAGIALVLTEAGTIGSTGSSWDAGLQLDLMRRAG